MGVDSAASAFASAPAGTSRWSAHAHALALRTRLQEVWTATFERLRAVGFVARFTVLGVTGGVIIASGVVWLLETRTTEILLRQTAARATDHVRLAIQAQVIPDDFAPPHTRAKLADLSARLAPILGGVQHDGSGMIGGNLVAPDGTVVYSELARNRGEHVGPSDLALLSQALAGDVASDLDAFSEEQAADLRLQYDSALEVYVPVVLDGHVIGAYEVYEDLAPIRSGRLLVLVSVAGLFGMFFHLGIRAAASARGNPAQRAPRVARAAVEPARVNLSPQADWKALTPRELEVLKLMATSHTYHEMAAGLGVSDETVRSHVKRVLHKLGQPDRTQAVVAALRAGALRLS